MANNYLTRMPQWRFNAHMAKVIRLEVPPAALARVLEKLGSLLSVALGPDVSDEERLAALALRQEFADRSQSLRAKVGPHTEGQAA